VIGVEPTSFDCYFIDHLVGDLTPELWRKHVRVMKSAGMNTFCTSYSGHRRLAIMIDNAIEEGMLEISIPVILMPRNGEVQFRAVMGDQQYGRLVAEEDACRTGLGRLAPGRIPPNTG